MAPFPVRQLVDFGNARIAVGAVVVASVVIIGMVGFASILSGPHWGLGLEATPNGVMARTVRASMVAWEQGMRPGERVLRVDNQEARLSLGRSFQSVRQVTFVEPKGTIRTATLPSYPLSVLGALFLTALLFVLLGGIVYRWTTQRELRIVFLVFCGAVALALVTTPTATYGYQWAFFLTGSAAIVTATSFTAFTLIFPRPVHWIRWAIPPLTVATSAFVLAIGSLVLAGLPYPPVVNKGLFIWFAGNLIGGMVILGWRARNSIERRALAPIAFGTAVGFTPLVALNVAPLLLFKVTIVPAEVASIGTVAIPMSFAYAILRHRLFGLDALLRNALIYTVVSLAALVAFGLPRLVILGLGGGEVSADMLGALTLAALAPRLGEWLRKAIDTHFYPRLAAARTTVHGEISAVPEVARAVARDARQFVPVRWATLILRGMRASETFGEAAWVRGRVVAGDGGVPTNGMPRGWRGSHLEFAVHDDARTVVPIRRGPTVLGALVVGPRLDGTPLSGLDREALDLLVERAAVPLEAALLHELTDEETRYREGIGSFARELAAAGSVDDVLAITAQHAQILLQADGSGVWRRAADGTFTAVSAQGDLTGATPIVELLNTPAAVTRRNEESASPDDVSVSRMIYRLGSPGASEAVGVVQRQSELAAFGPKGEQRLTEIAEHANGALGRAHALAAAAEAETLREVDRFRTEFLDMVSHDLQNPLTVIRGFTELLQYRADTLDPTFLREATDSILIAYRSCQRLIDDLLTTARIEKGRLTLNCEDFDVTALLAQLVNGYHVLTDGERVGLSDGPALMVRADRARVEQMVGNLVTNALRYARTGPVTLSVRSGPNDEVWIEVTDQGPGIALADQEKIWEKFYRTASGERTTERGTGVGLSVVRTLAELHGGRAELESAPEQGSTFRIVLPAAIATGSADATSTESKVKEVAA